MKSSPILKNSYLGLSLIIILQKLKSQNTNLSFFYSLINKYNRQNHSILKSYHSGYSTSNKKIQQIYLTYG